MRMLFFILFLQFGVFAQGDYQSVLDKYYDGFPTISCTMASRLVGQDSVIFVDTREQREFDVSHIKGAICVGYDNLIVSKLKSLDRNKLIIVYCSVGARSQNVGKKLGKLGFTKVKNLYGGFFQWTNSGLPKYNLKGKTGKIHGYSPDWGRWIRKGIVVYGK